MFPRVGFRKEVGFRQDGGFNLSILGEGSAEVLKEAAAGRGDLQTFGLS